MNSDQLKREKIREAITARLLQLSRQSEEVCGTGLSINNPILSLPEHHDSSVLENYTSSPKISKTENSSRMADNLSRIMINNFVSPRTSPTLQDKAFYRDYVPHTYSRKHSENENEQLRLFSPREQDDPRFFMTTPSTDLEHYMNRGGAEDSDTSLSLVSSESELTLSNQSDSDHETIVSDTESNESNKWSLSPGSEPVTVVSLSSDDTDSLPIILNELKTNTNEIDQSESRTPRRRRLSYTLEQPSPVLQKVLRNQNIGPENNNNSSLCDVQDDLDVKADTVLFRRVLSPVIPTDNINAPPQLKTLQPQFLSMKDNVSSHADPLLTPNRTPTPPLTYFPTFESTDKSPSQPKMKAQYLQFVSTKENDNAHADPSSKPNGIPTPPLAYFSTSKATDNSPALPKLKAQYSQFLNTKENVYSHTEPVLMSVRTLTPPHAYLPALEAPKLAPVNTPSPVKSRIPVISTSVGRPNVSSVLQGPDTQFSKLELKNKALKQYLNGAANKVSPQASPKRQEPASHYSTHSEQLTSLDTGLKSLQCDLHSIHNESSQQRHLLEEVVQQLQQLNTKQDSMVQRVMSIFEQQMTVLQQELSGEIKLLFAQNSRTTEIMMQGIRDSLDTFGHVGVQSHTEHAPGPVSDVVDLNKRTKKVLWNLEDDREETPTLEQEIDLTRSVVLNSSKMNPKFDRISAAVKGYLTRRLMKTEKVQGLIKTIKDAMDCALRIHEMAMQNTVTGDDAELHKRLIVQVTSACHEFHDVFFKYSVEERMNLIAQSRELAREKTFKVSRSLALGPYISSATIKSLERKKMGPSKSVSPNSGRKKWKPPKRSSTSMSHSKPVVSPPPRRLSLQTPTKEHKPRKTRGDRSPSFYM